MLISADHVIKRFNAPRSLNENFMNRTPAGFSTSYQLMTLKKFIKSLGYLTIIFMLNSIKCNFLPVRLNC